VLQCVASAACQRRKSRCVAECCILLQSVTVRCTCCTPTMRIKVYSSVQSVAVCCSLLQSVAVCCSQFICCFLRCESRYVAAYCSVLERVAAQSIPLRCVAYAVCLWCESRTQRNTRQHTATHCITLQHIATYCNTLRHIAARCSTLQHTATHCNTLQHTAALCNTLRHTGTCCSTLQNTALQHNTLQHIATHCIAQLTTPH